MKAIDTAEYQICDRCSRDIPPEQDKLVVGLEYEGEHFIEVYCSACAPIVHDSLAR